MYTLQAIFLFFTLFIPDGEKKLTIIVQSTFFFFKPSIIGSACRYSPNDAQCNQYIFGFKIFLLKYNFNILFVWNFPIYPHLIFLLNKDKNDTKKKKIGYINRL